MACHCQSCWGRASTPSFYVSDVCLRGISNTLTTRLNERRPGGTQDVEIISHLNLRLLQRRSRGQRRSHDLQISPKAEISQSVSYFTVPPRAPPLCRTAEQTIKPDLPLYLPCSCPGKVERRKTEAACAVRRPVPRSSPATSTRAQSKGHEVVLRILISLWIRDTDKTLSLLLPGNAPHPLRCIHMCVYAVIITAVV